MAVRWRTARPMAKTISRTGTASTIGSKPVLASWTRTAALRRVVRPRAIHARLPLQGHRGEVGQHEGQRQAGPAPGDPPEEQVVEHHDDEAGGDDGDDAASPPQHGDGRDGEERDHGPRVRCQLVDHGARCDVPLGVSVVQPDVLDHQHRAQCGEGTGDRPVDGTDPLEHPAVALTHGSTPQALTCSRLSVGAATGSAARFWTTYPIP